MSHIRRHLTYSNVMATIAVFVAVGGGTAFALAGHNTVFSDDIVNGQVKTPDLANGAVTAPKLACKGNDSKDAMVRVGSVCIDRYEDSIWTKRTGGTRITGAIPCNASGSDCKGKIFARSVRGVTPRENITWFQAQQALANSGKRLPTNAEWQQAVAGTPEGQCNTSDGVVRATGSFTGCVSDWGAHDMVGNVFEWVADWDEQAFFCDNWPAAFSSDTTCIGAGSNQASTHLPAALLRGGNFNGGTGAGPFANLADFRPSDSDAGVGFRGAR